jgi:hypothetical protein
LAKDRATALLLDNLSTCQRRQIQGSSVF